MQRTPLRESLPFLAGALLSIGAQGCGPAQETATPAVPEDDGVVPVYYPLPDFELTDHLGGSYGTAQLRGRVWVADFIFTRCQMVCPAMTRQMTDLQAQLYNHPSADDFRLVSFSVDPEHDTVEVLRDYARQRAFAYDHRWRFLTGAREAVWSLSKDGFKLAVGESDNPHMPVAHSQKLALVDRAGNVRGYYDSLATDEVAKLLRELDTVLAEPSDAVAATEAPLPFVPYPKDAFNPSWLEPRRRAQLAAASEIGAFHDFRFTDRITESGILFVNRVVDDAGPAYKGVHYDHGNGIAIADVDGDGRSDIYFTTQLGRNQLWRNRGDGTFEDVTTVAGVGLGDRISVTASFADTDNDGDPDLFVTTVRGGNVLFVNNGDGTFTDVAADAGLGYSGHSSGAVFFDYDRDGLLDLFLAVVGQYTSDTRGPGGYYIGFPDAFSGHLFPERTERSILYRNTGGNRFVDVTEATGLVDDSWSGDASPADLNEDGYLDLYVLNMQGNDEYFENVGGERFVRKSRELFPATPWGSMSIKVFDYDNDGRMDVFLSDMHSDMSEKIGPPREKLKSRMRWSKKALGDGAVSIFGNALFHNQGGGRFREVSDAMGTENYWPWGFSVGDLNADGFDDVFLTSGMNLPWRYGVNTLLLNDGGEKFRDSEFILGVEPRKDGRTVTHWFEFDCSGDLSAHPLYPMICKGRSGRIEVQGALGSRASVIFDLDGDGDLDIVTNEFNSEPMVLISDLSQKTELRYLQVKLVGRESNRDGLGARVTVTAGGRSYVKVHDGKSGYLSQSSYPLYFGLGAADAVDRIEVRWPSGKTQTVTGPIAVNVTREIEEG